MKKEFQCPHDSRKGCILKQDISKKEPKRFFSFYCQDYDSDFNYKNCCLYKKEKLKLIRAIERL